MLKKITLMMFISMLIIFSCSKKTNNFPTIGVFQISSSMLADEAREGFIHGLKEAGYEDNKNINLDIQNAQGEITTAQLIAQKFVSNKVDIICAITTPCLQSALQSTKEIPIVFGAIANPYKAGAGESANNHKANVTGASATSPIFETMELIKKTDKKIKTLGVIWNPSYANSVVNVKLAKESAAKLGLVIKEISVSGSSDVLQAAESMVAKNIDLFYIISDHSVISALESVVKIANQHHIPMVSNEPQNVERGVAMALGWDYYQNGAKTAQLAVRILKGENPKDINFQGLDQQSLSINLQAAKQQNLNISEELIKSANKIIK